MKFITIELIFDLKAKESIKRTVLGSKLAWLSVRRVETYVDKCGIVDEKTTYANIKILVKEEEQALELMNALRKQGNHIKKVMHYYTSHNPLVEEVFIRTLTYNRVIELVKSGMCPKIGDSFFIANTMPVEIYCRKPKDKIMLGRLETFLKQEKIPVRELISS